MSEKITITFEIEKADLSAFTEAVTQKFESVCNQAKIYRQKNPSPEPYYLDRHTAKAQGFSNLYLACIKGLLNKGDKNA